MTEIPETMSAVVATPDGPRWTERRDVPAPEPEDGEALVAVRAFAVNRGELSLLASRGGGWQPGQDVAGVVVRAAADGSGPRAGARVAGLAEMAGWGQYAAVPADRLAVLPDGVGYEQAAALPMAGTTALNVVRAGGALLGQRVLVTGASGGVGGFAVQLAAIGGARVTAVARSEHAPRLAQYGASEVVADVGEAATGAYDVVLESVGGAALAAAFERIAPGGVLVAYGNSSRAAAPFDFFAFAGRDDARVRTYFSSAHAHEAGAGLAVLLDLLAAGRLRVELGVMDSWDRLDDALDRLRDRRLAGKAVFTVG
jgi:NADPH:quinone reductase